MYEKTLEKEPHFAYNSIEGKCKTMKKLIQATFLLALLLAFSTLSLAADGGVHYLEELDLTVEIPSGYTVFTRTTPLDDPDQAVWGFAPGEIQGVLSDSDSYLFAVDETQSTYLEILMTPGLTDDYHQLSDDLLNACASGIEAVYKARNITSSGMEKHQHKQAVFLVFHLEYQDEGMPVFGTNYDTVYAGKRIYISLTSYSGPISDTQRAFVNAVLDSATFGTDPVPQEPPAPQEPSVVPKPFLYTDSFSGLQFTVPAHWTQEPKTEQGQFDVASFVSTSLESVNIRYVSEDLYSSEEFLDVFTPEELASLPRAAVDNALFDALADTSLRNIFANLCSGEITNLFKTSYGGKEYYRVDALIAKELFGYSYTSPGVILLRLENGYLYMFYFTGSDQSPYFADFEVLVESASYPAVSVPDQPTQQEPPAKPTPAAPDSSTSGNSFPFLLLIVPILALLSIILAAMMRKKQKAKTHASYRFCHKCGAALSDNDYFCVSCGASIPK